MQKLIITVTIVLTINCTNREFLRVSPLLKNDVSKIYTIGIISDAAVIGTHTFETYYLIKSSIERAKLLQSQAVRILTNKQYSSIPLDMMCIGSFIKGADCITSILDETSTPSCIYFPYRISTELPNELSNALRNCCFTSYHCLKQNKKAFGYSFLDTIQRQTIINTIGTKYLLYIFEVNILVPKENPLGTAVPQIMLTLALSGGMFAGFFIQVSSCHTMAALIDIQKGVILWSNHSSESTGSCYSNNINDELEEILFKDFPALGQKNFFFKENSDNYPIFFTLQK